MCAERLSGLLEYLPSFEAGELAADCACVLAHFGRRDGAEALLTSAEGAKGSCAYLRVQSLFLEECGEAVKKAWENAAKKLPMQGQREWENFFLRADAAAKTARA